jgi:two-component system, OmpR family, response regulator VicR
LPGKHPVAAKTILLAEDERMIRDMLLLDLEEHGVQVETAVDGEEALEMLSESTPDLILLDILMPRKDGFAVLAWLADNKPSIPVVMLSNLSSPDHERTCRTFGAKDFIVKSELDVGEIWERIEKFL